MATVGFFGSRDLPQAWYPSITAAVAAFAGAGRTIATGCAVGADAVSLAAALQLAGPARVTVYTAFDRFGRGAWRMSNVDGVRAADLAGADVHWLAGGSLLFPLVTRLRMRSRAMVAGVTPAQLTDRHSGIVGWITALPPRSPGSWATVRFAAHCGLRVVLFNVGWAMRLAPLLGPGRWVSAGGGIWTNACLWQPD